MSFRRRGLLGSFRACSLVTSFLLLNEAIAAEPNNDSALKATMRVMPAHCVVFREGQYCDKNIQIEWQTSQSGAFCIYVDKGLTPLRCWKNLTQGAMIIENKITQSTNYFLREENSGKTVATDDVAISWVYESIRKSRSTWKIF